MTSEPTPTTITCPKCDAVSTPDNNFCGNCGASLTDPMRDYACAVGSAILALNGLESEVFYLLDILGVAQPSLEGAGFISKIAKLEEVALQQTDTTRERLDKIASEARRLADERNNFAHGLLWIDGFTGEHKRRFVRQRDGHVLEDARPPEMIQHTAFELIDLAGQVSDLAMEMGGLERWEEYYDLYLAPALALRNRQSVA
jgi:hypothetical protein